MKSSLESAQVVVRCRPLIEREISRGSQSIVTVDQETNEVKVKKPGETEERSFTFDSVYGEDTTQQDIFEATTLPIIEDVIKGYNGTIFSYGQTGTGKTYTMTGDIEDQEIRGLIPRSFEHIFDQIEEDKNEKYIVKASYIEIYNEEVSDLLGKKKEKVELKESKSQGIFIKGLTHIPVSSSKHLMKVLNKGMRRRNVASTMMNANSNRAHYILGITVECVDENDGESVFRKGTLNMIDLAGSERVRSTCCTGERLKEAVKINLSLSTLCKVISALTDKNATHIPYRESKLTRALQESLGGNCKTLIIADISPADIYYDETISTLRLANRAKGVKNRPKVNSSKKESLLSQFLEEYETISQQMERDNTELIGSEEEKEEIKAKDTSKLVEAQSVMRPEEDPVRLENVTDQKADPNVDTHSPGQEELKDTEEQKIRREEENQKQEEDPESLVVQNAE